MKKKIIKIILICIFVVSLSVIFSGCSITNPEQIDKITDTETSQNEENTSSAIDASLTGKEFKEISVDEAYNIFISDENYLFIDVRSKEEYDKNHVKGAVCIPMEVIKENLNEIPQNKIIIVYCNGTSCDRSSMAAEILVQNGFAKVYRMGGLGILEWIEKDYPVE